MTTADLQSLPIPCVPGIEESVLAAILRSDGKLIDVAIARNITANSFYQREYQEIYSAMLAEVQCGGRPDLPTMGQRMLERDKQVRLAEISGKIATDTNFELWLADLKMMEAARDYRTAAMQYIDKSCGITPKDVPSLLSSMASKCADALSMVEGRKLRTLDEITDSLLCQPPQGKIVPYFPWGTEGYFKIRHHKGEMHVICANTGTGKTALAAGAVKQQLEAGLNVAYFCFESNSEQILGRIAAQFCGIPHYIMQEESPCETIRSQFKDAVNRVRTEYRGHLFICGDETNIITPEAIRTELARIVHKVGHIDVAVIDFLQYMQAPSQFTSPMEQVNYCIKSLHKIFTDFNAAGIVLAQINRAGQQVLGENERPGLQHIKDSSVIPQLAHTVSFLRHKKNTDGEIILTEFYSAKTRNQAPFNLELSWNGVGYESESASGSKGYSSDDIPPAESNGE